MKILIGTKNKAKTLAVKNVASLYFPEAIFENQSVSSLVADQPVSNEETRRGAINRARQLLTKFDGDIAIGLEGGVTQLEEQMYVCNWGALATAEGQIYTATGAGIPLPEEVATQIREGKELGPVMDVFTNKKGIRHEEGAVGVFTDGLVNRSEMFEHIMKLLIGQYLLSQKQK